MLENSIKLDTNIIWNDTEKFIEIVNQYKSDGKLQAELAYDLDVTVPKLQGKLYSLGMNWDHSRSNKYCMPPLEAIELELRQTKISLRDWCRKYDFDYTAYRAIHKRFNRAGIFLKKHSYDGKKAAKKSFFVIEVSEHDADKFKDLVHQKSNKTPTGYLNDLIITMTKSGELL